MTSLPPMSEVGKMHMPPRGDVLVGYYGCQVADRIVYVEWRRDGPRSKPPTRAQVDPCPACGGRHRIRDLLWRTAEDGECGEVGVASLGPPESPFNPSSDGAPPAPKRTTRPPRSPDDASKRARRALLDPANAQLTATQIAALAGCSVRTVRRARAELLSAGQIRAEPPRCEACGRSLEGRRRHARYCSNRCRHRAKTEAAR